jgi:hypothetical protein
MRNAISACRNAQLSSDARLPRWCGTRSILPSQTNPLNVEPQVKVYWAFRQYQLGIGMR